MATYNRKAIGAWVFYDWANSVYNLIIVSAIFPIWYAAITAGQKGFVQGKEVDLVNFFGREYINTELYTYVLSFSFFLVVVLSPILSGIADYVRARKRFLQFFCYLGSAACISLFWFDKDHLEVSMLSVLFASVGFWGSLVYYNSFLPQLAPKRLHDRISARGFSYGYVGSVILLVSVLVLNSVYEMNFRYAFVMVGIWWAGFAQYTYIHLPNEVQRTQRAKLGSGLILKGHKELMKVWKELRQIRIIKWFLSSYFVYNMGVQTIMTLAVVFAEKEIAWPLKANGEKDSSGMIISIILIQLIAIVGATVMARLSRKFGNIRILLLAVGLWTVITITAYFIYQPMEFYLVAACVGFVMGGIQSLSRSTYSKMLPPTEDHASYFSFYDVMEKIGLIIGPLLFGLIEGFTGDMRLSVLMLVSIFVIGFILLLRMLRLSSGERELAPA